MPSDLGVHGAQVLAAGNLHEPAIGRPQLDRIAGLFSEPDRGRQMNRVGTAQRVLSNEPRHGAKCRCVDADLIVRGPVCLECRRAAPVLPL
jgi:hypothetical protein